MAWHGIESTIGPPASLSTIPDTVLCRHHDRKAAVARTLFVQAGLIRSACSKTVENAERIRLLAPSSGLWRAHPGTATTWLHPSGSLARTPTTRRTDGAKTLGLVSPAYQV